MGKFRLDIMKSFVTERVVSHWNSVPREVVVASGWSEFKEHLKKTVRYVAKL